MLRRPGSNGTLKCGCHAICPQELFLLAGLMYIHLLITLLVYLHKYFGKVFYFLASVKMALDKGFSKASSARDFLARSFDGLHDVATAFARHQKKHNH